MIYYQSEDKTFTLFHGDTKQVLNQLTGTVDMIFADPPYFCRMAVRKYRGDVLCLSIKEIGIKQTILNQ